MSEPWDLVVVGGGPGGYVAAIRASQLGLRTAVVESAALGGVCLNWGCIPTKALLHAADLRRSIEEAEQFGITVDSVRVDVSRLVARSREVAEGLSRGVRFLMKKNRVTVVEGRGRYRRTEQGPSVVVTATDGSEEVLQAREVILATGARPRAIPGLEPDGERIWTSREAMVPEGLPERLLVVGAGAIGIEFASFYRDFGSEVTVVERLDRILPVEDEEISAAAAKMLAARGMKLRTATSVAGLECGSEELAVRLVGDDGTEETMTVDRVLVAAGISANTEDLGLEDTGVELDRGHVVTDEWMRTGEPGVRAIGDMTGGPWLAHKATQEGVLAAEHIALGLGVVEAADPDTGQPGGLHPVPLDKTRIPACTYAHPQVASVGLTEAAAKAQGHEVRVGRFPLRANGKALASGGAEGFIKTLFDATTGELLGAHMIGAEVTELIHSFTLARTLEATEAELFHTVFPHPTVSEALHESVLDAFGRALHI